MDNQALFIQNHYVGFFDQVHDWQKLFLKSLKDTRIQQKWINQRNFYFETTRLLLIYSNQMKFNNLQLYFIYWKIDSLSFLVIILWSKQLFDTGICARIKQLKVCRDEIENDSRRKNGMSIFFICFFSSLNGLKNLQ